MNSFEPVEGDAMASPVKFGLAPKNTIIEELEQLRKEKRVDELIQRALAPDSNVFILEEVLNCVKVGQRPSVTHKDLLTALSPALTREAIPSEKKPSAIGAGTKDTSQTTMQIGPQSEDGVWTAPEDAIEYEAKLDLSRNLKRFLFLDDVLPGNSNALSLCASIDGSMLAYSTAAAAPLKKIRGEYVRSTTSDSTAQLASRSSSSLPRIVNVISFNPYEFWTLPIDEIIPELGPADLKLVALNRDDLFAVQENSGRKKLFHIGVRDGRLRGTHDLGADCGPLFLDAEGQRCTFIDTASATVNRLCLSEGYQQSYPLSIPTGVNLKELGELVFNTDGTVGVILVSPRFGVSLYLMAALVFTRGVNGNDEGFSIRWFSRKETWLDRGFEEVRFLQHHSPMEESMATGTFYFMDATTAIFSLPSSTLIAQSLDGLDPTRMFTVISESKGGKKSAFPVMAIGSDRPLLITSRMATKEILVWDISTRNLLLTLHCPFQADQIELVAYDSLLIVKSRSVRSSRDSLYVTFLDFLFLAGQTPAILCNEYLPVLGPLEAWAPDDSILDCMRRLMIFNSENTKEASA
jgi:hypothetical protein